MSTKNENDNLDDLSMAQYAYINQVMEDKGITRAQAINYLLGVGIEYEKSQQT